MVSLGRTVLGLFACILALLWAGAAVPAPYAAMVIDARTGEVLHSRNADTKLHPASLTKMMTLYVAFQAVERGEISLDTRVTVSQLAANEPPSRLGLRAGQRIALRYLIRAAAIRSANDAATAIGQAISGSERNFARRMTQTAQAMGMRNTTFRNAHGLTQSGHLSTARDMTTLGRHVLYDFPEYYNLFSRQTANAGIKTVRNTNRRLLNAYRGADGIKTGYTRAAGFNLVASAERGSERIIATVFGGRSVASRNARVAELLDMGFSRAPTHARVRKPRPPRYTGNGATRQAAAPANTGRTIRTTLAVARSLRPQLRPVPEPPVLMVAAPTVVDEAVQVALTVVDPPAPTPTVTDIVQTVAPTALSVSPMARPTIVQVAQAPTPAPTEQGATLPAKTIAVAAATVDPNSTDWAINVGKFESRRQAERVLIRTALAEMTTLDGAVRKVQPRTRGYEALFVGMTRDRADLACRRLQAQQISCLMVSPG